MNHRNNIKEKIVIDFIKQNNYEIDFKLLKAILDSSCLYTYFEMMRPVCCRNGNVYGRFFTKNGIFISKFKDIKSINVLVSHFGIQKKQNYNFNYDEKDLLINNYSFTVTYNYKVNNINEIAIIDKNSKKLLIVINQKEVSINSDIFKLFDNEVYKRYQKNQKWLTNSQEPFPKVLIPIITKYQVLLSLSS